MTTRQKVAVKHVNVMDRVPQVDPRTTLVPAYTVIRRVDEDIDVAVHTPGVGTAWFGGFMDEFDDRTLGSLVGTGLLGE